MGFYPGQPWLVNALAHEAWKRVRERIRQIEHDDIIESREVLIRRRDTHLDQLADKLREDRVKRVIEPLLIGELDASVFQTDDVQYVRDLGLIRVEQQIEVANPIYREIIPYETVWFVDDGHLMMDRLFESFQEFLRGHSEHWLKRFDCQEAWPQLLLQAFLQRIVNADGRIEKEFGSGQKRIDLLIVWQTGKVHQKFVVECKRQRNGLDGVVADGLAQTRDYMDRCGTDEGHLLIFDQSENRSWAEKVFRRGELDGGKPVTVWGM